MTNFSGKNLDNAESVGRKTEYQDDASQRSDLPEGWVSSDINSLCRVISGNAFKSSEFSEKGILAVKISNIQYGVFEVKNQEYLPEGYLDKFKTFEINPGDVLIALTRPITNGLLKICDFPHGLGKALLNQRVAKIQFVGGAHQAFFKFQFRSKIFFDQVSAGLTETLQPNLSPNSLGLFNIIVPPLAEQQQIAQKLDELLAQVDTLKTRLDAIPKILKRFRQSVLAAAVCGRLTEEWRENHASVKTVDYERIVIEERQNLGLRVKNVDFSIDPSLAPFSIPESWAWKALGSVALKITDGAHNTPKVFDEGYPYLMAKDLTGGQLDFSEKRFISEEDHRELYLKCRPQKGDLLIVNIGAGTGNNVLVDVDFEFSFKNIAIIKRPSFINPKFLKYFYESEKQRIFSEQTKGGAQPFLSLTVLNNLFFALPPLEEQTEIVRRVEQLFAYADQIEQRVKDAQARVNHLTQSILAKAFRGELTAQWRAQNPELISGENSAAALLERIKAEREVNAKPKKKKA